VSEPIRTSRRSGRIAMTRSIMNSKMPKRNSPAHSSDAPARGVVDRAGWLEVARDSLIENGIDSVKIEPLAARLAISRSSFYWHFKNRRDLLDALLKHWKDVNDNALRDAVERQESNVADPQEVARERLQHLADLFIYEEGFSSRFDLAIREWARKDAAVAEEVARIDSERIALFQKIFLDIGHSKIDSLIRAKILYFHQLGYYLVGIKESASVRQRVAPRYLEILSGLKF
jgi:AcrR family transcriptional regulator